MNQNQEILDEVVIELNQLPNIQNEEIKKENEKQLSPDSETSVRNWAPCGGGTLF